MGACACTGYDGAADAAAVSDAFVSYSRRDAQFVLNVVQAMQAHGKEIWMDVEGIADGEVFPDALQEAIETAVVFVYVISPDSASAAECAREAELAVSYGKRIVPRLPPGFRRGPP